MLKWLEIDLVWHRLKIPSYRHWYHAGHRKKAEYHWFESRFQKEGALVPGQLILRCLRNQACRTMVKTASHPSRAKGLFCPCLSLHSHFLLLSSFSLKCPHVLLGNVFIWDLKPDLSVFVERFPQKRCFRGLQHPWEGFKCSCINIIFMSFLNSVPSSPKG